VVFVLLADWQMHRRAEKLAAIALVTGNYDRRPVPVASLLASPAAAMDPQRQWTKMRATGHYAPAETLLVRNRPADGDFGYLVLVPLRLDGGGVLLVDRGWIADGPTAEVPSSVPAPPKGHVTVVARLLPGEPHDPRSAPEGQVQAIDLSGSVPRGLAAAGAAGRADAASLLRGGYGRLVSEDPAAKVTPEPEDAPDLDEGPHLGYAVQWVLFAVGAWAFLVVHMRRAAYDADVAAGRRLPRAELTVYDPDRRPSDEEVEDAAVDAFERAHAAALVAARGGAPPAAGGRDEAIPVPGHAPQQPAGPLELTRGD
jgi:cytochrome oxidase assembly protein ShyY1